MLQQGVAQRVALTIRNEGFFKLVGAASKPCAFGIWLVHKLSRKIRVLYSRRLGTLLQVGAGIVTAFDDLIVKKWLLEFRHLRRKLSGMYGPYAIDRKSTRLNSQSLRHLVCRL